MAISEYESRMLETLTTSMGSYIAELLNNDEIVEIMLNPDGKLWAESLKTGRFFTDIMIDPFKARQAINTIATGLRVTCNDENPIISAELPGNGSRFQGMLPPIVANPTFTIRKKALLIYSLEQYVADRIMTPTQYRNIVQAIKEKNNILVVGGTGSGKTTLLNAILNEIAKTNDRIVIIEDTQELQCSAPDTVFLRSKEGVASMQDLLKSTMRLRPDRIVVGEVRGGEALTLLKAWNTGHPGGCASTHASGAFKGIMRIQELAQEAVAGRISRDMVSQAINIVIYIERVAHGRILKEIIRVNGYVNGEYVTEPII